MSFLPDDSGHTELLQNYNNQIMNLRDLLFLCQRVLGVDFVIVMIT